MSVGGGGGGGGGREHMFTCDRCQKKLHCGDRNACKFYLILVSSHYGFGLMDADKMVQYAKKWTSVPEQVTCEVDLNISR